MINIASLFKGHFFKLILNEAVEITFAGQGNYDILANILSLLSEEKLENAIPVNWFESAFFGNYHSAIFPTIILPESP